MFVVIMVNPPDRKTYTLETDCEVFSTYEKAKAFSKKVRDEWDSVEIVCCTVDQEG